MVDELSLRLHEVSFRLRYSVRYHQRRARFFDGLDLWAKAISVLAGTAAFAAVWKDHQNVEVALWLTAAITGFSTFSLVFGFSTKARLHLEFVRKYLELESEIVSETNPTVEFIAKIDGKARMIEAQEPPTLGALVTLCQNEIARQEGQLDYIVTLPVHQRLLAHFFDFEAP